VRSAAETFRSQRYTAQDHEMGADASEPVHKIDASVVKGIDDIHKDDEHDPDDSKDNEDDFGKGNLNAEKFEEDENSGGSGEYRENNDKNLGEITLKNACYRPADFSFAEQGFTGKTQNPCGKKIQGRGNVQYKNTDTFVHNRSLLRILTELSEIINRGSKLDPLC
jgi:hypothetical protein